MNEQVSGIRSVRETPVSSHALTIPFEMPMPIDVADIDELGHVNNTVYLRWVQEVAVAHWRERAPRAAQAEVYWVVLRHEIEYKQPAVLDDAILLRTWVGAAERLRFERFTEVLRGRDRQVLAQAKTVWCPVDPLSGRPRRVSHEVRHLFSVREAT